MDSSDYPTSARSPRKELLGPRPAPLRVHKDSHKIKKPPVAPQPPPAKPPPRQPIIIYTVSPKVIHTNPSDFMNLVQRLTGLSSTSSEAAGASNNPLNGNNTGAISPAARYSMIENARYSSPRDQGTSSAGQNIISVEAMEMDGRDHDHDHVEYSISKGLFHGILSPGPASLPPVAPPNFFSPPSDSFFHDLSPVLQGLNRNFIEGSFMPSPSYFASSSIDLFNNFPHDL